MGATESKEVIVVNKNIINKTNNDITNDKTIMNETNNDNNNIIQDINIVEEFSILRKYLVNKVPFAVGVGGVLGTSAGYLIGNNVFLYGYTYSFGLGFVCTSYYSGIYALEKARKKDDIYNHGISGAVNGALLGTGLYGIRKGLGLGIIGLGTGIVYKFAGDNIYRIAREAWINSRIHTLSTSKPRRLEVHKPLFPPKPGQQVSIIPSNNK